MADLRAQIRIDLVDGASANAKAIAASTERLREAQLRVARAAQVVATNELRAAQAALEDARAKGKATEGSDALARAELRAAKAAQQLAKAETAAARAEGQHATAAGRTAEAVGSAMPAAADTARRGLLGVSDANKKAAFAAAGNFNAIGELAYSFGNLTPATRGLGLAMVMAGGNAFAFAGSMGLAGVALGATLGIIPGLIDLFRHLGSEAEDAGSKAAEAAKEFHALVDARLEERRELERARRIETGEADSDEIEAAIESREALADDAADRVRQMSELGRAARGSKTDAVLGLLGNLGGAAELASSLGSRILEGDGLGKFAGASGLGQAGRRAAREARSAVEAEAAREQGTADRLRTDALPVALEREAQEDRERTAAEAAERVSIARRRFGRELEDLPIGARQRQRIEQAVGDDRFVELPSLVRGLPADVRERVTGEASRVADASGLARRAELAADQARIRQLDEARATERARGGDDLGRVTVGRGGGGGQGGGAEIIAARGDDPSEAANTQRTAAEIQLEAARESLRAAQLQVENERRRSIQIDTGPSPIGGAE